MATHISQLSDRQKNAALLAKADLPSDAYHQNIKKAANVITGWLGHPEDCLYITQYASGNSTWKCSDGYRFTVNVKDGTIS